MGLKLLLYSPFLALLIMPSRRIRRRQVIQNAPSRAIIARVRPMDPIMTAVRLRVPNAHIPQHNVAPAVMRVVRLSRVLSSAALTTVVTYNDIALQDQADYDTGSTRYQTMRVTAFRAWMESSPALVNLPTSPPFTLVATEATSDFTLSDRPTTGSRLAAIGMRLPFVVRTIVTNIATVDPLVTFGVALGETIPADLNLYITVDFTVEFYG